jgi:outer membrane biosynthesis protein TonB
MFYSYLEQNVIYPKNALKKGVQAHVKVSLIIDANGSITNVFPLSKHEWGFEETLIRTIKEKKQFGFVMHNKKPVQLYLEIPFIFKIQKK